MTRNKFTLAVISLIASLLIQACGNEKVSEETKNSDLRISASDLYWGTRDVGVVSTQRITLTNQSSNKIRINGISLSGANSAEFYSEMEGSLILNAGETAQIPVSFKPHSEGRKFASLDINYDIL